MTQDGRKLFSFYTQSDVLLCHPVEFFPRLGKWRGFESVTAECGEVPLCAGHSPAFSGRRARTAVYHSGLRTLLITHRHQEHISEFGSQPRVLNYPAIVDMRCSSHVLCCSTRHALRWTFLKGVIGEGRDEGLLPPPGPADPVHPRSPARAGVTGFQVQWPRGSPVVCWLTGADGTLVWPWSLLWLSRLSLACPCGFSCASAHAAAFGRCGPVCGPGWGRSTAWALGDSPPDKVAGAELQSTVEAGFL